MVTDVPKISCKSNHHTFCPSTTYKTGLNPFASYFLLQNSPDAYSTSLKHSHNSEQPEGSASIISLSCTPVSPANRLAAAISSLKLPFPCHTNTFPSSLFTTNENPEQNSPFRDRKSVV